MTEFLHQFSFGMMVVAAVIATIVSVERIIFSGMNMRRAEKLLAALSGGTEHVKAQLGQDVVSGMVTQLLQDREKDWTPEVRLNHADAAYLHARDNLSNRLWLLDTIVTAAPLMGLLGTIFGIVDTFLALSKSGMSDPAGVSAGIGTALYATALGITIALLGLMTYNYLSDRNERIGERLKMLILRIG